MKIQKKRFQFLQRLEKKTLGRIVTLVGLVWFFTFGLRVQDYSFVKDKFHIQTTSPNLLQSPINQDGWQQIHVYVGNRKLVTDEPPQDLRWFSQHQQDETVFKFLNRKQNGYFIDLAANDAIWASNTFALEKFHGWSGICIEANPFYWYRLANRKCHVVGTLVGEQHDQELRVRLQYDKVQGPYGGIVGDGFDNKGSARLEKMGLDSVRKATTLENILTLFNAPTVIDYMSLDVEGAEEFIMKGFPFDKYRFSVISIERPKETLVSLLQSHGYRKVLDFKRGDTLWAHDSILEDGKAALKTL